LGVSLCAQTPAATPKYGSLTKIDTAGQTLEVKTDAGEPLAVTLDPKASFRRIPFGETDLRKAETIALTDVAVGDRVMVRGKISDDQKSMSATLVLVMAKAEVAKKQAADQADWDKRGVSGEVTAVAPDSITLKVRGKPLVIALAKDAVVRRYAPDSVKFADAKVSTLAEVKVGDQARARGEKNADGSKMVAEEVLAGTFRTIAATVTTIDGGEKVLRIRDLDAKKPVILRIGHDSSLKKLTEQMAQMIAFTKQAEKEAASAPPGGSATPPAPPAGRAGGPGGPGGRGAGGPGGRGMRIGNDLTQILDRAPTITLADLKPGDAIIVLSTVGANTESLTAITLLAGVEPILTRPGTREMSLGGWSLGTGGGGGEQ
jgi:co-chaperonin GroES (HSP10)